MDGVDIVLKDGEANDGLSTAGSRLVCRNALKIGGAFESFEALVPNIAELRFAKRATLIEDVLLSKIDAFSEVKAFPGYAVLFA